VRFVQLPQQLGEIVPGDHRGFFLHCLLRELHAPRRVGLQIPVFDRRFENAGEKYPGISNRLPANATTKPVRDPLLNRESIDVAESRLLPRWQHVHLQYCVVAMLRRALERRQDQHLPLLFDEYAELDDRFRPDSTLVDGPETLIQPDLRITPRRQVRYGAE
jgi:hypothetical protein